MNVIHVLMILFFCVMSLFLVWVFISEGKGLHEAQKRVDAWPERFAQIAEELASIREDLEEEKRTGGEAKS